METFLKRELPRLEELVSGRSQRQTDPKHSTSPGATYFARFASFATADWAWRIQRPLHQGTREVRNKLIKRRKPISPSACSNPVDPPLW